MARLLTVLSCLPLGIGTAIPLDFRQQQQHTLDSPNRHFQLIDDLKQSEIIPTVLDPFTPFLSISITWPKASAQIGNTIKPKKLQTAPTVQFIDALPEFLSSAATTNINADTNTNTTTNESFPQLTLVLTDPDARSRENPDWSEMCHWIATNVPITLGDDREFAISTHKFTELVPYQPPGPPPKTGKHRYVFAALAPVNGTHEPLNLTTPADRQHWGYRRVRAGLRDWAKENGLVVIGANFIYSQNKKG